MYKHMHWYKYKCRYICSYMYRHMSMLFRHACH